jgi:hypothetical protein
MIGSKVGEKKKAEKPVWDGHADSVERIAKELQISNQSLPNQIKSIHEGLTKNLVGPQYVVVINQIAIVLF